MLVSLRLVALLERQKNMYGAHQKNLLQGSLPSVTKRRGWRRLRDSTGSLSCRRPTAPRLLGLLHTVHNIPTWLCIVFRHCKSGKKTATKSGDIIRVYDSVDPVYQLLTVRVNESYDFLLANLLTC
jgi:hypothetical protein